MITVNPRTRAVTVTLAPIHMILLMVIASVGFAGYLLWIARLFQMALVRNYYSAYDK